MIEAYPLAWPAGWKRTVPAKRRRAHFGKGVRQQSSTLGGSSWLRKTDLSVTDGTTRILNELYRMCGIDRNDVVISTNVKLRLDGLPRSGEREPDDPGVAVYWTDRTMGNAARCMAIDIYDRVADNLGAVAATIEAMRAIERHGGAEILNRAFTGFTALPAPGKTSRTWRDVLDLSGDATIERARENFRRLAAIRHPDRGGSHDAMTELNAAWAQAQTELAK